MLIQKIKVAWTMSTFKPLVQSSENVFPSTGKNQNMMSSTLSLSSLHLEYEKIFCIKPGYQIDLKLK